MIMPLRTLRWYYPCTCPAPDCNRAVLYEGQYCDMHAARLRRKGSLELDASDPYTRIRSELGLHALQRRGSFSDTRNPWDDPRYMAQTNAVERERLRAGIARLIRAVDASRSRPPRVVRLCGYCKEVPVEYGRTYCSRGCLRRGYAITRKALSGTVKRPRAGRHAS